MTPGELRNALLVVAKRSISIVKGCSNIESTRLYLALPFLGMLGYDHSNPYEIFPEHRTATFDGRLVKVDFAVLRDGAPIIGMECRVAGASLGDRENLSAYFRAMPSVKLAIQTNGTLFAFFVASDASDVMDPEPFLTLDLESLLTTGVSDDVAEYLSLLTKQNIASGKLIEAMHLQLVRKRLRKAFLEEAAAPSAAFCRFALERIGVRSSRPEHIEKMYAPLVKSALEESLILPLVQKMRHGYIETESPIMPPPLPKPAPAPMTAPAPMAAPAPPMSPRMHGAEEEPAILGYVRRRLAYLLKDETLFSAIEHVHAKDYVGRIVLYYDRGERKGRMFDYIMGDDGTERYIFPEPIGEIRTRQVKDIDQALQTIFMANARELGTPAQAAMQTGAVLRDLQAAREQRYEPAAPSYHREPQVVGARESAAVRITPAVFPSLRLLDV